MTRKNSQLTYFLFIFIGLIFLSPETSLRADEVVITISKQIKRKIRLTIVPTQSVSAESRNQAIEHELHSALLFDLTHAGYFEIWPKKRLFTPPANKPFTPNQINYDYWLNQGTEFVLGSIYDTSTGKFEIFCYDIALRTLMYKQEGFFRADTIRANIHAHSSSFIEQFSNGRPAISTSKIAYVQKDNTAKNIFYADYDGHSPHQITFGTTLNLYPKWAADTPGLFFVSYRRDYPFIFFYNMMDKTLKTVSKQPGLNAFPVPSPDGSRIAATLSLSGNPEIYVLSTYGNILNRITYNPAVDSSPTWSPDGTHLAFVSDRSGTPQIYIVSANGGPPTRITYHGNYNSSPDWNPIAGSNLIAYSSLYGKNAELCIVDISTDRTTRLTTTLPSEEDPSWAPDGWHISYTLTQHYRSDIYFMDIRDRLPVRLTDGRGIYSSSSWQKYPIYYKSK